MGGNGKVRMKLRHLLWAISMSVLSGFTARVAMDNTEIVTRIAWGSAALIYLLCAILNFYRYAMEDSKH